jgi:hypothetical protein
MKHLSIACIFALISLSIPAGQWTQVGGVTGGNNPALVLFSHKGSLYAAVEEDGIFRSTDQGRTWSAVNTGIPETPFVGRSAYAFVVSGNDLFVGAGGVYRLNSQGDGWVSASNGLPALLQIPLPVAALTVSGTTLFAAISSPAFSGRDR